MERQKGYRKEVLNVTAINYQQLKTTKEKW